jgi:hypothetical protein
MQITKTAKGVKVLLKSFPTDQELEVLNTYGKFELDTKRGYPRLLHYNYSERTPFDPCIMECPIGETFTI